MRICIFLKRGRTARNRIALLSRSSHLYLRTSLGLILACSALRILLDDKSLQNVDLRQNPSILFGPRPSDRVAAAFVSDTRTVAQPTVYVASTNDSQVTTSLHNTPENDVEEFPPWMSDYFKWHAETIAGLDESNWEGQKYLLLTCVQKHQKCSGASDRLQSIPIALLLAHQSRRILLIYWSRPAPLEEFLVPPPNGLDWRVPTWLRQHIQVELPSPLYWLGDGKGRDRQSFSKNQTDTVVRIKNLRGFEHYEAHRTANEPSLEDVYAQVWKKFFHPSIPVQDLIDSSKNYLNLTHGSYVAVHVRALYRSDNIERKEEENAIRCAAELTPEANNKIYFAADNSDTVSSALNYSTSDSEVQVLARQASSAIHLDRGSTFLTAKSADWKGRKASDFYDVFVDLYMLAGAECVVYGAGSYGKWASLLSRNHSCAVNHRNRKC